MTEGEFHVASYVLTTRPEDVERVVVEVGSMTGLEVHGSGDGKIIVTAEAGNVRQIADMADGLTAIESVISVAPVYHEYAETGDGEASI